MTTTIAPRRQRGAALLTAMIIVALIATLAASMLWQQWRAVQVESAERERAQSAWLLAGALDWARLILREDGKTRSNVDHLGEPWAVPLQEARLSSFLADAKVEVEDAPEAFISGDITDAKSRFNLTNLVAGQGVDPRALGALQRLCSTLGVSLDVAQKIATGMRDATPLAPEAAASGASAPASGAAPAAAPANPPLLPAAVDQLVWFGIDPGTVALLAPYLTILPQKTNINANTASREVLASFVAGMDLATAERIVQARQRVPFKSAADVQALAPAVPDLQGSVDVASEFFDVRGRLRLGAVVLEQHSLVQRRPNNDVIVLRRERVSSRDNAGT